jgi:hypothetical protein
VNADPKMIGDPSLTEELNARPVRRQVRNDRTGTRTIPATFAATAAVVVASVRTNAISRASAKVTEDKPDHGTGGVTAVSGGAKRFYSVEKACIINHGKSTSDIQNRPQCSGRLEYCG